MYRASSALLALALAACSTWPENRVVETKRRGDVICGAIAKYRAQKGNYPLALRDLQPRFIREVQQPTVGYRDWHYELVDSGRDYSLEVVADEFGPQLDRNSGGQWHYYPK